MRLPCSHVFHVACLFPWMEEGHLDCPTCRCDLAVELLQFYAKGSPERHLLEKHIDERDADTMDDDEFSTSIFFDTPHHAHLLQLTNLMQQRSALDWAAHLTDAIDGRFSHFRFAEAFQNFYLTYQQMRSHHSVLDEQFDSLDDPSFYHGMHDGFWESESEVEFLAVSAVSRLPPWPFSDDPIDLDDDFETSHDLAASMFGEYDDYDGPIDLSDVEDY